MTIQKSGRQPAPPPTASGNRPAGPLSFLQKAIDDAAGRGYNTTALEYAVAESSFPGELPLDQLLAVNAGLLCLHLFLGGICFLASCLFSDAKYSVGFVAGIPALMYVLQMLANSGGKAENAKYFTAFTLFDANGLAAGETAALGGAFALLAGAVALYAIGITVFCRKDLHI